MNNEKMAMATGNVSKGRNGKRNVGVRRNSQRKTTATAMPVTAPQTSAMLVIGGMVGAGIFSLPRTFARATGPFGAIIAWLIAGTGMYMLARVFQYLAERKPDLDAGVFAYAKAGFGDYPGFLSAFGYWIGRYVQFIG